jgi:peptidoglycan L-alanyl-D-glutamate endopeptidase CwlK
MKLTLRQEQSAFALSVMRLFAWLYENGYEWTLGEAHRTPEQQEIYVKTGRSKTYNSLHIKRLAIDLFIFKNGKLLATKEEMQPVGNAWEQMDAVNSWGGNWNSFKDIPHFERTVK